MRTLSLAAQPTRKRRLGELRRRPVRQTWKTRRFHGHVPLNAGKKDARADKTIFDSVCRHWGWLHRGVTHELQVDHCDTRNEGGEGALNGCVSLHSHVFRERALKKLQAAQWGPANRDGM